MAPTHLQTDLAGSLAFAVVAASQAPLLLLDEKATVLASSDSFLKTFGFTTDAVCGRSLFILAEGAWDLPRLRSLLSAVSTGDAVVDAHEMDFTQTGGPPRRLILNAKRLEFTEGAELRILLTLVDATAARAAERLKNDLIRDKDILLQEIQHRVANSLQIIASVLLQNAKTVSSEESRGHLRDAHQRVMSVAAVQRQLATSSLGDVILKPYFSQLCQSIGASMIEDHRLVSIVVDGDGIATTGEVSVSLGLIVTELVINALKHAFPDGREGVVTVDYHSQGEGWALSVCDNGIGMLAPGDVARAGLGTAIVQALAQQLSATIAVTDLEPGTGVSVVYREMAGIGGTIKMPDLPAV
jgi:PAS domain S-box-containing protein